MGLSGFKSAETLEEEDEDRDRLGDPGDDVAAAAAFSLELTSLNN